jgi:pSer/pThr/pTyr-binding forkhead associated (FHA) protein
MAVPSHGSFQSTSGPGGSSSPVPVEALFLSTSASQTDVASNFALKFISGKYQGGEFPLRVDKEIVIGRSSELDMVLVEDMVSRKHAKITVASGKVTIQDLGSTNGTFVNGEKIKQARLKEGDRILIGTSILKLVASDPSVVRTIDSRTMNEKLEQVAASKPKTQGAMSGRIDDVPIPDLLQLFQTSKKNGVLAVTSGEHEGRVYLRKGQIYYAIIDGDPTPGPRKSFFRIVAWETGSFMLEPPDGEEFPVELDESTEALLMEALRQLDEQRKLEKELPPATANLGLAQPLVAPLRDLSPEQLDVLQLAINYSSVRTVLDKSELTDRDTCEALLHLLKNDYLRSV